MTKIELARLAAAMSVLRPDWPVTSLQTFLGQHLHRPLLDVAVALTWVATDPDTKTPARLNEAGPWWSAARTVGVPRAVNDCPTHPLHGLRVDVKTGATRCAGCYADRHADDTATAVFVRRPVPETARRRSPTDVTTPARSVLEEPTATGDAR